MSRDQFSWIGVVFTILWILVGINEGWPTWQVLAGPVLIGVIMFFLFVLTGGR
jgi:hypothetical protein